MVYKSHIDNDSVKPTNYQTKQIYLAIYNINT